MVRSLAPKNPLLAALPGADYERLVPRLQDVQLVHAQVLAVRAFNRRARDLHRERIIPQPVQLDRVIRYETHLTRQLSQTLAHLRQLQQARLALPPAPPSLLPSEEAGLG